jgi:hypothetical protein
VHLLLIASVISIALSTSYALEIQIFDAGTIMPDID